jgi:D-inositol-3-phosphate glycosyltransferase
VRIAIVADHSDPCAVIGGIDAGGQNVHVAALAKGIAAKGHEVAVFTRGSGRRVTQVRVEDGYSVWYLPAGPSGPLEKDSLWVYMEEFRENLQRCFLEIKPQLVHAHFWMSAWAAEQLCIAMEIPLVITFHALGSVKRRHQGALDSSPAERIEVEARLIRSADLILATSSDEVSELVSLGGNDSSMIVIPCGVDVNQFSPASDAHGATAAPSGFTGIVSVGRLVRRKGFDIAIRAVAGIPDAELTIVGGPPSASFDGDAEVLRLREVARVVQAEGRVRLLGPISRARLPEVLRAACVVVCSPAYEPFGMVALEAMACGVPVVATAVGGLKESVLDGKTGILVEPNDPISLRKGIQRLLRDPDLRLRLGQQGRTRAETRYSWTVVVERTIGAYRGVIRQG